MIQSWILYSLGSGLAFASMALAYKKAFSFGLTTLTINLFAFGFAFLVILGVNLIKGTTIAPPSKSIIYILIGAIFFIVGNYFYITAVSLAPNPGYATALKATEIIFATFLAFVLFRSQVSLSNILGILLIFLGVFLVAKK